MIFYTNKIIFSVIYDQRKTKLKVLFHCFAKQGIKLKNIHQFSLYLNLFFFKRSFKNPIGSTLIFLESISTEFFSMSS